MSAGRYSRFLDTAPDQLFSQPAGPSTGGGIPFLQHKENVSTLLQKEKLANSVFSEAWNDAKQRYDEYYKGELPANFIKKINEDLPKKLPESLKSEPESLAVAVIVYTEGPAELFDQFSDATRQLFSSGETNPSARWSAYQFKSLYILLQLAQKHMPSRPNPNMGKGKNKQNQTGGDKAGEGSEAEPKEDEEQQDKGAGNEKGNKNKGGGFKSIFRGVDTDEKFTVGQKVQLGYFAPFTVKRILALGLTVTESPSDDEEEDDVEAVEGAVAPTKKVLSKTMFKILYTRRVSALGVRFLSPHPDDETEIMVAPHQVFNVKNILKRPKKGFSVVILSPVE